MVLRHNILRVFTFFFLYMKTFSNYFPCSSYWHFTLRHEIYWLLIPKLLNRRKRKCPFLICRLASSMFKYAEVADKEMFSSSLMVLLFSLIHFPGTCRLNTEDQRKKRSNQLIDTCHITEWLLTTCLMMCIQR